MTRVSPVFHRTLSTISEEPANRSLYIGTEDSKASLTVINIEMPYMVAVVTERSLNKRKVLPFSRKASKRGVLKELNRSLKVSKVNIHNSPSSKITKKEIEKLTDVIVAIVRRNLVASMPLLGDLDILMNSESPRYSWRPDWLGKQPTYKNFKAESFENAIKSIISYHLEYNFSVFKGIKYCLSQKNGKGPLNDLVQELDMHCIQAAFPGNFSVEVRPLKNRSFEVISVIDGIRLKEKTISFDN